MAIPEMTESEHVAAAVNTAAFAFQRELTAQGNLLFSPLSVYCVLRLLYEGSGGETRGALARLLGPEAPLVTPPDLRVLLEELESLTRPGEAEGTHHEELRQLFEDRRVGLRIASAIWIQERYPILPAFLQAVRAVTDGDVTSLDFERHPEQSCDEINAWVADRTQGRITNMLSGVSPSALAIAANTLYFKASWDEEFNEPVPGPFHLLDGGRPRVPMLRGRFGELNFLVIDEFSAVELPYYRAPLSMMLVMPRVPGAAALAGVERNFSRVWGHLADPHWRRVDARLTMPQFTVRGSYELTAALRRMGLEDVVGTRADWSGISEREGVYIDRIQHDTYIKVDRYGTEATAAMVAMFDLSAQGPQPEPRVITIERPFLFAVWHWTSGVILFLGKVEDPTAGGA